VAITIRDVAEAAGVSTATVSRALRGLPNVDEATRARVQAIAAELDYVISPSASRLASGRTGSIGVITPYISRWFFSTVISGVESVLQSAGMDLLLMSVSTSSSQHRLPPAPRLRRRVDGVLAIALQADDPQLDEVLDLGLPTSLIGTIKKGVAGVSIEDFNAACIATQHLINLGHSRIGVIRGNSTKSPSIPTFERYRGYRETMLAAGIQPDSLLEAFGYFTLEGGEQAMTALLTNRDRPTAVFAMSDEMAFGAIRAVRAHGLVPGKDISIIGVDNHSLAELMDLTTVAQPVFDLGRVAAEALLVQIRTGGSPMQQESIQLPTQLIVRGSTSPVM
jgi:DNA-binding LacI/PurR family transcriptional regulator